MSKDLPTIRDYKDPFQRDVRERIRLLKEAVDALESEVAGIDTTGGITLPILESDVTGLETDLAGKAALVHTHSESDVTGLVADLAAKVPTTRSISTTAPVTGGGDLSTNRIIAVSTFGTSASGIVPASGGGSTNYLRADGTWAAPPGAVTLPIAESDVTSLTTDLAAKALKTTTISTTSPLSGGGDLSANRTLTVATNSTSSAGVVPQAPNDTTQFWRGDASWASLATVNVRPANIWDPPATPGTYDDEFDSTTLNAAWTAAKVGGTATWTANAVDPYTGFSTADTIKYDLHTNGRRSWLRAQPSSDGNSYVLYKGVSLPTNCFFWARFSNTARMAVTVVNDDFDVALILNNSSTIANHNALVGVYFTENDASASYAKFLSSTGGVFTTVSTSVSKGSSLLSETAYQGVGIQKLGTTYHGWLITGGGQCMWMGSVSNTNTMNSLELLFLNKSNAAPGNMIMSVDFVRYVASATFLP